jgi:adenine-specific DNA-methyltransferase
MQKLDPNADGKTMDIVADNIAKLKALFPEIVTEGKVDFEALKEILGEYVEDREERYSFTWNGKSKARMLAHTPSNGTLRPCPGESVDFNSTQNLFIEGENLEVLKLLQKSYYGKIKMIYIDPPYNTGKDFVYSDTFGSTLEEYLSKTRQRDQEGYNVSTNVETSGRFHTNWLNMMYARLKLARNLLSDDGMIFVSINENEFASLKFILFEIFGEENHCADFVWNTEGNTDNQYKVKVNHEYIVAMYKNAILSEVAIGHVIDPNTREDSNLWKGVADNNINKNNPANPPSIIELPAGFPCSEDELFYEAKSVDDDFFIETRNDKYISDDIKERYGIENLSGLPVKLDDMIVRGRKLVQPCRIYVGMANKNKLLEFIANGCNVVSDGEDDLSFYINSNAAVRYHKKNSSPRNILSVLRNLGTTERTRTYLKELGTPYDYPKPLDLIKYLIRLGCEKDDGIVLDFFAGSGTTAEAILSLNAEDNKKRRFILAQLPEFCEDKTETYKAGFKTLTAVGKERIRRILRKIKSEQKPTAGHNQGTLPGLTEEPPQLDLGFKVFKLDSTNIKPWDADFDNYESSLDGYITNIKPDRSEEDVLYEILLKYGLDLTLPIEERTIADKNVFIVGLGALVLCLANGISLDVVEGIADLKEELKPEIMRVVFKDNGFSGPDGDVVKTNTIQILRQHGITDVKSL